MSWRTLPLSEVADILGGGTPSRQEAAFFGGTIPWVTPTDLGPIGTISLLSGTKETLTELGLNSSSAKLIQPGSVLFSSRASIGKIAVTDKACATNQGFINLTPNPDAVDPWFLAYLLCHFTPEIRGLAGQTTFLEVPRGQFRNFKVKLPGVAEQRRIVARIKECMNRIDEITLLRDASAKESKALHRSFYHEQYERLCSNGKTVRLDQAAKFIGGGTPSKQNPSFWKGMIPWISPKDMKRRDLYDATDHISDAAISGSSAKLISDPSVLFVVRGMILAHTLPIAVNRVPVAINQDMKAAVPNEGFDVDFLAAMLRGAEQKLLSQVEIAGHGTCRLQQPHWTGLPIPVLTPTEQANVVAATQAFESIADRLKSEVCTNESEAMRAAVLRKAFAGEL